ncbi:prolylcarboxypeptidase [Capsaspora owczarzaki ATCC 30864]|uniref:Prolylcarboxypeptidase n=1 Tax=Capsaspora owczarzaki (strain ATCC 30864) TaxID=595528 RepID=A0A0D2X147_CAPO3|nr:prolylcarboxypeptidase [Capsaspora owczarzaki ATCC 30864]KJE90179.1 prolylcarboxypeptidase [Capsaspora owczarzaki ATCC 30864]|eukprot:XP_004364392.1 prolylcarboxypeptidase [Capsaspora owczarzaki ATCC 30864]
MRCITLLLAIAAVSIAAVQASPAAVPFASHGRRLPLSVAAGLRSTPAEATSERLKGQYNYDVKWFTQTLDHFRFDTNATFQQRYLISTANWNGYGPMFFYTGNEGDIEWFADNTGFVWEIAAEYNALVVFAEHRYYGQTMPFGDKSFDLDKVGYLTTEQALADFAILIPALKAQLNVPNLPVVAFGGSYGGMLAGWFRLKYPNVVDGAIAASAPIVYFQDLTSTEIFNEIATNDFALTDARCPNIIRDGFSKVDALSKTAAGLQSISKAFKLCGTLQPADYATFIGWLEAGLTYMAMTDYPYASNFLQPMPAWPVDASCKALLSTFAGTSDSVAALNTAVGVYYNYTGQTACNNISSQATSDLGVLGWDYQSCTEMVMPMGSDGIHDMFPAAPWDLKSFNEYCKKRWNVVPRPTWAATSFGGFNITAGSNIVFSNGMLDPWSGGSITQIQSQTLVVVNIPKGAHHLDLRSSNPADPQDVIDARNVERAQISRWISR